MNMLMVYWQGLVYTLLLIVVIGYAWMMLADAHIFRRTPHAPGPRTGAAKEKRR